MSRFRNTSHLPFSGLLGGTVGGLLRRLDHVADPAHRLNQLLRVLVVDLAAQVADVDVDDIGEPVVVHIPDMLDDHRAAERTAAIAHHVLENSELLGSKVYGLGRADDFAADAIEGEIADLETLGSRLTAAQERADTGQ